jgi:Putative metallopeptidase
MTVRMLTGVATQPAPEWNDPFGGRRPSISLSARIGWHVSVVSGSANRHVESAGCAWTAGRVSSSARRETPGGAHMVKHVLGGFLALAAATAMACSSEADNDQEAKRAFWAQPQNQARLDRYVDANVHFAMLHEAAHYLFRVLDVPVAGREEDAADRFAVSVMLPAGPGRGGNTELTSSAEATDLVWVAYSWLNSGRNSIAQQRARIPWYDEHGAAEQRGYDILCLLYGSNPKRFELTVQDPEIGIPSADRLARCSDESARNSRAYEKLLGAFEMTAEEVARRAQHKVTGQPARSGSAAADILRGNTPTGGTGLLANEAGGISYRDYESREQFWAVPWFRWDSLAFIRAQRSLERVRDILGSLRLPDGTVIPTITAQRCGGEANAFFGFDPPDFYDKQTGLNDKQREEERKKALQEWMQRVQQGLVMPQITLCYPLVDGISWVGRELIWRSEQQRASRTQS